LILKMKPYKFFALVCLVILGIIITDGIVKESNRSGFPNKIYYFFQVDIPGSIAAGLFPLFMVKNQRYKILLRLCVSFSLISFIILGYVGKVHYEGSESANDWLLLFVYNPFEIFPFVLFTTLVSVGISSFCYFLGAGFEDDIDW
jgi:hypothetical protein